MGRSFLLTYSIQNSPSYEANQFSPSQEIPTFYGIRRFITAFTSSCHLSLSWTRVIQSIPPHSTSWKSILILSYHLCLGLPRGLFPYQNLVYTNPLPHTCYMPHPSHSSRFDNLKKLGEEYRSQSSSLCCFLHSPVTLSLLGPNILLSILFWNNLPTFLPPSEQPSFTPIKIDKQNYSSVYLNLCIFGYQTGRQKILHLDNILLRSHIKKLLPLLKVAWMYVCVYVCVCERERERETVGGRERDRIRQLKLHSIACTFLVHV